MSAFLLAHVVSKYETPSGVAWLLPSFYVLEFVDQSIKVDGIGCVKVEFIPKCGFALLWIQGFVEAVHSQENDPWQIQFIDKRKRE